MRYKKYFFVITILFFVSGLVNIHFALLGIVCMTLPMVLLLRDKRKTWCQSYCPRGSLFSACGKLTVKHTRKAPRFFTKGNMKWIMLGYFGINLLILSMSTIKVATGDIPAMDSLRFLLLFSITDDFPQFITFSSIAPWLTHLSFRFYSMMMTTTILGLLLLLFYKPRTWCTICPIATVSDVYIKKAKVQK